MGLTLNIYTELSPCISKVPEASDINVRKVPSFTDKADEIQEGEFKAAIPYGQHRKGFKLSECTEILVS